MRNRGRPRPKCSGILNNDMFSTGKRNEKMTTIKSRNERRFAWCGVCVSLERNTDALGFQENAAAKAATDEGGDNANGGN